MRREHVPDKSPLALARSLPLLQVSQLLSEIMKAAILPDYGAENVSAVRPLVSSRPPLPLGGAALAAAARHPNAAEFVTSPVTSPPQAASPPSGGRMLGAVSYTHLTLPTTPYV